MTAAVAEELAWRFAADDSATAEVDGTGVGGGSLLGGLPRPGKQLMVEVAVTTLGYAVIVRN